MEGCGLGILTPESRVRRILFQLTSIPPEAEEAAKGTTASFLEFLREGCPLFVIPREVDEGLVCDSVWELLLLT
jgi:hypothetical protein